MDLSEWVTLPAAVQEFAAQVIVLKVPAVEQVAICVAPAEV